MCLYVNSDAVQTSDEDITVYKVLTVNNAVDFSGYVVEKYYTSPYRITTYKMDATHRAQLFSDKAREMPPYIIANRTVDMTGLSHYVTYGLHTFETYEDAVQLNRSERFNGVIVECTIPKGTRMFKGKFPVRFSDKVRQCDSYASEVLIVNKIVEN